MKTKSLSIIGEVSDLEDRLYSEIDERSFIEKSTDWYFRPKSFERSSKLYEALGVRGIKKVCDWIGKLIYENPTTPNNYRIWDRSAEGLKAYERETRLMKVFI